MPKRAGLYLRISQDRSGEGLAVDRQREDGGQLIRMRGWALTGEYVDNDISAAGRKSRPGFQRLVEDIRTGQIDVVVSWALDRLVRSSRDRLTLIEACRAAEVSVALVRGSDIDLTTAAGRLFAGMLGEFAQHEIDQKSERQRRAIQQAAEAGKPGGGPRAFGYTTDGMHLDAAEAPVLRDLYHRFLTGQTTGELQDWLNLQVKVRTPQGRAWSRKSVRVVLGNPRNCGRRGLRASDPVTHSRAVWHETTWPGVWPAVVSQEEWEAAVALLRSSSEQPWSSPGGNRPRHLLSGVALCGLCGRYMISGQTRHVRTYTCSGGRHLSRKAEPLEGAVQEYVLARLRRPDAAGLLADAGEDTVAVLRGERGELRGRLDRLAADYSDGILDREQVRSASTRLRDRLQEVDAQLASAGRPDVLAPLVLAEDDDEAWATWAGYAVTTRRLVIARLVRVTVMRVPPGPPRGGVFDLSSVRIEPIS